MPDKLNAKQRKKTTNRREFNWTKERSVSNTPRSFFSTIDSPKSATFVLSQNILDTILANKKYAVLTCLIHYIQQEHRHENILELIINKLLDQFLDKFAAKAGSSLIKMSPSLMENIRDVLPDFYMAIDEKMSPHQKSAPANNIKSHTDKTAMHPRNSPTLSDIQHAVNTDNLLHLLNNGGWEMGCNFTREKNWAAIREYLIVLKTLSRDIVSPKLHAIYWGNVARSAGNSFLGELIKSMTPPEDIIFDLLATYQIEKDIIRDMARLPSMKQNVKRHISTINDVTKRIALYEQCLDFQTSLGIFCHTTVSKNRLSKFLSDYDPNTGTLREIKVALKADKQSFSEPTQNTLVGHSNELPHPTTHHEEDNTGPVASQQYQRDLNLFPAQREIAPQRESTSSHSKQTSKWDYITYAYLIFICIQAAFEIYCSCCKSKQNEPTPQPDEPCNYFCSP